MKNILCYGDSNTYGFNPKNGSRFSKDIRWTGILSQKLNNICNVIEEGCNARTAWFDSTEGFIQSGCGYFPHCLAKYDSIDSVILALGINDMQIFYKPTNETVKDGIISLIDTARQNGINDVVVIAPSIIKKNILNSFFSAMFDEKSIEMSKIIPEIYKNVAKEKGCDYIDLNDVAEPSDIDGLHYTEESHKKIAEALFLQIYSNYIRK